MTTVDLSTPAPTPESTLDGLPRRIALTLPELQLLARLSGDAPLPFDISEKSEHAANPFESRLGKSRQASDDEAYAAALDTLHDPVDSLSRRGLIDNNQPDAGIAGALGLLAAPAVAVEFDVSIDGARVRAWHRQRGHAVAALATADGVVFELTWFDSSAWAAEMARAAVCPEDLPVSSSSVPDRLDLPFELLDAGAEAVRSGRSDLLSTVVAHHSGTVVAEGGRSLDDASISQAISALSGETRGRLRALVADVARADGSDQDPSSDVAGNADEVGQVVGVLSWVLLADGWRSLRPHNEGGEARVEVIAVQPSDLAACLGPVLAEVSA